MGHFYQKSHVTNFCALHRGKDSRDAPTPPAHPISISFVTSVSDWCRSLSICCWFWPMPPGGNSTLRKKSRSSGLRFAPVWGKGQNQRQRASKKVERLHLQPRVNISYCNLHKKVEIVFHLYVLEWKIWRTKHFWHSGRHLKSTVNTPGSSTKCLSLFPTQIPHMLEKRLKSI